LQVGRTRTTVAGATIVPGGSVYGHFPSFLRKLALIRDPRPRSELIDWCVGSGLAARIREDVVARSLPHVYQCCGWRRGYRFPVDRLDFISVRSDGGSR
jgi:hypothetical protein